MNGYSSKVVIVYDCRLIRKTTLVSTEEEGFVLFVMKLI